MATAAAGLAEWQLARRFLRPFGHSPKPWRDRDVSDIRRLLALHRDSINFERIGPLIREIFQILGAEERIGLFEQMIEAVRSR